MEVMMNSQFVRIESITIENFKNVRKGVLDFENRRKKYRTSIVGLYGQNGSGKTALIDAIQLLKYSLCGKSAPNKYADYINVEKAFSTLKFQFKMQKAEEIYNIWYQFSIKKVLDYSDIEGDTPAESEVRYKVQIFDEVLSFAYLSDKEKIRKSALIDTRTAEVFVPKAKYNELLKNIDEDLMEMFLTKRLAQEQSRSFIFSREMMNRFRKSCEIEIYLNILNGLSTFGNRELFIIDTQHARAVIPMYILDAIVFAAKDILSEKLLWKMVQYSFEQYLPDSDFDDLKAAFKEAKSSKEIQTTIKEFCAEFPEDMVSLFIAKAGGLNV